MVLRHSIVLNITIVKQKKLKKRGTHSTCQRLGNSLLLFLHTVLTGSPVPTMHRWSQFGGQRCASNVHGRGWTSGREECLTRHACRRFAPACSDKENRRFAPVLPGWDEPGAAVHCLSEHVSVYLQIGLFSEGITGDHIGITLFRGDHRGSHERFHIYRLTYQPGQRGSHQSVIR